MASRAEQKAAARAAREAAHREMSAAQARRTRLMWLGGLVAAAVVAIVIIVVAIGGNGGTSAVASTGAKAAEKAVYPLLEGIPENGNVLGNPKAPVTLTEFGDLVCPVCQDFALTSEQQIITNDVRAGAVKIVYRGLETASSTANAGEYVASQVAARAAGLQNREWYYILLWYHEQCSEQNPYVTDSYMQGLAQQVPGLSLSSWESARSSQALANDVTADTQAANAAGFIYTPSITITGPKGSAPTIIGVHPYSAIQAEIQKVS
jgi:protein-disulfide isomerase